MSVITFSKIPTAKFKKGGGGWVEVGYEEENVMEEAKRRQIITKEIRLFVCLFEIEDWHRVKIFEISFFNFNYL